MAKVCTKCKLEKELSEFYANRGQKSGLNPSCKVCQSASNKASLLKGDRKAKKNDYDKIYMVKYNKANRSKRTAQENKRRAGKLEATPPWLTEDHLKSIYSVYELAKECEVLTGDKYHVDHIVPLQGKNVCGLHVPWNLQVLPADINIKKGNRFA